jgi:CO/xanthine dehydrogenase Mo-binding subunit
VNHGGNGASAGAVRGGWMEEKENRYSVIGRRIPKIDSLYLATGQAQYLDDIRIPGLLYGKILRSPHPHARIESIDVDRKSVV